MGGREGSSPLPAHVYRAVLISGPYSSTALTHGVDMIRGLPLHGGMHVCVGEEEEEDRQMNDFGASERDHSR